MCQNDALTFQAISWHAEDVDVVGDDAEDGGMPEIKKEYKIKVFGMDNHKRTVSVSVCGFTPYFYVKVPQGVAQVWGDAHLRAFKDHVTSKMPKSLQPYFINVGYRHHRDMWGFTNNQLFTFIRLEFTCLSAFRAAIKVLGEPCRCHRLSSYPIRFQLYESNIDPYIRFMHTQNIKPCGWIQLAKGAYSPIVSHDDALSTSCQIDVETQWRSVKPHESADTAAFLIASFDIECMSHAGDFPMAKRDYTKLANELVQVYARNAADWNEYTAKTELVKCIQYAIGSLTSDAFPHYITRVKLRAGGDVDAARLSAYMDDLYTYLKNLPAKTASVKLRAFLNSHLPALDGDPIIQIGTTFHAYGEKECSYKHILTLGTCDPIEGVHVEMCEDEQEMLLKWRAMLLRTNPDIMCGYNIFGFDMAYMMERAQELQCFDAFMNLGRFVERECTPRNRFHEQRLSSSALGDNILKYIVMEGRVQIDVMKCIQRDHKLDSYKLDNVAHTFMDMNKNDVSPADIFRLQRGTSADRKVVAEYCVQDCALCNHLMMKLEMLSNNMGMANVCLVPLSFIFMRGQGIKIFSLILKQCKDDGYLIPVVSKPTVLNVSVPYGEGVADVLIGCLNGDHRVDDFRVLASAQQPTHVHAVVLYSNRDAVRTLTQTLARGMYCSDQSTLVVQEAEHDYKKSVQAVTQQLVKAAAAAETPKPKKKALAASKKKPINEDDDDDDNASSDSEEAPAAVTVLAVQERDETMEEDGYEGAIVLEPQQGIYIDEPVSVLDYASLYPSSMISENLSHDCIVLDKAYDNLPGVEYLNISYDLYEGTGDKKRKVGERTCRYVQLPNGEKGILPRILMKLLNARKATRKSMQLQRIVLQDGQEVCGYLSEDGTRIALPAGGGDPVIVDPQVNPIVSKTPYYNAFQKAILDGLQLAYKVTANSLYGQMGARTSPVYLKDIAACTTATGRNMILAAKEYLEKECNGRVVYGDTDSVFVVFDNDGLRGKAAIAKSIENGIKASDGFKKRLKPPHDLEYEKTFYPLVLITKKRYVGNVYEHDDVHYKQKSMGIVLKRRDNAPIVKRVYGGVIDIILTKQDINASAHFLQQCLEDLVNGQCPMEELIVTKSLRADYKDPTRIAHKVLADRMAERDPGNKPQTSDRIPYAYIQLPAPDPGAPKVKVLQGNRIETPAYIREHGLKLDYGFYITNQIMKPVLQIYALVVEKLSSYRKGEHYFQNEYQALLEEYQGNQVKAQDKLAKLREKEVQDLLFEPYLKRLDTYKPKRQAKPRGAAAAVDKPKRTAKTKKST